MRQRLSSLPAWRRRTGIALFVLGSFLPSFIPLIYIIGFEGWVAVALTGAFSIGLPELLWLMAAIFIGRDGVAHLWRHVKVRGRLLLRLLRRP
ncbi:MAG: hypothetical protein FGM33_06720 [Candidatus Kapabacteria bacterium]|nr:hypothetical protein [Candidatus Kapabacteria bacterium]